MFNHAFKVWFSPSCSCCWGRKWLSQRHQLPLPHILQGFIFFVPSIPSSIDPVCASLSWTSRVNHLPLRFHIWRMTETTYRYLRYAGPSIFHLVVITTPQLTTTIHQVTNLPLDWMMCSCALWRPFRMSAPRIRTNNHHHCPWTHYRERECEIEPGCMCCVGLQLQNTSYMTSARGMFQGHTIHQSIRCDPMWDSSNSTTASRVATLDIDKV